MDTDTFIAKMTAFRESLKGLVAEAVDVKNEVIASGLNKPTIPAEVVANVTLAYRHLEDAAMRFGKAIQAADGGVSPLGGPNTPSSN